jgi:hypothetical protein
MNSVSEMNQAFLRAGFALVREKNHPVWRCPCGHKQVTSSNTHCEGRADRNSAALIRRTLRECRKQRRIRR